MSDLFFYAIIGIFGGIGLFVYGFFQLKKKRLIENIPTSKIRSMAMGLVEVKGRAIEWMPLTAPFSNVPAVYYTYKVEELRRSKNSTYWATIHKGRSKDSPFYIEDDTGQILIHPKGAEFNIPVDFTLRTGILTDIPAHIVSFLEEKGVRYKKWFGFSKTLRFTEHHIAPNDCLYIMGVCKNNRQNLASVYRKKVQEVMRKVKADPKIMKQFDKNNDGHISQEEWELARQIIGQKVREQLGKQEDTVFIGKGEHRGQLFYISDHSEKALTSQLAVSASGGVFGGAILTLISLGYVLYTLTSHSSF